MPGCVILSAILIVFGGLVILYTVVALYQNRMISGFTDELPVQRPVANPTSADIDTVARKLKQLESAAKENRLEQVRFTAGDLNVLIASQKLLADFRGQTHIARITASGIEAEMSQPMRKGFPGGRRYLNALFILQPELRRRTVHFQVIDIRVPGRQVPRKFVEGYAGLEFFRLDPKHDNLGPVMSKLGRVCAEEGVLVVETRIGAPD